MPKTSVEISIVISLAMLIYSCNQHKDLVVQAINKEFNHQYLTGEGLDTNYFNTNDVVQYYQVSNYSGLAVDQILTKLDRFALMSFPSSKMNHLQKLTLLFYKKEMFIDYNDHLYESARNNDNRRIEGYSEKLLATITFEALKERPKRMSSKKIFYENGKFQMKLMDTIIVR
jgi:hypothetical protein